MFETKASTYGGWVPLVFVCSGTVNTDPPRWRVLVLSMEYLNCLWGPGNYKYKVQGAQNIGKLFIVHAKS